MEPKRQLALQYIQQAQEKWKSRHQVSAQAQTFHLGDKIMVHRTSLQNRYDVKFEPKWKGPYIIHQVLDKGAYKIKILEGKILKHEAHGNHLKKFHEKPSLIPMVIIEPSRFTHPEES